MYNINNETAGNPTSKYFAPGIHSDVTLINVAFEPTKEGSSTMVLAFHFAGKNGEAFRHIEFEVDSSREDAQKKMDSLAKRIKHILSKFMPEDQVVISGSDWDSFCKNVIALLGNNHVEKKVAIKLVYKGKYLSFTPYIGFIANNASDLRVGPTERITPEEATPSNMEDSSINLTDDSF